ncbi:hypothetical protein NPIL_241311 [Nephila pilipes]|uniref:Uncharacterized protein n=1 Tax=Nephila pilipes TaxID=299642 RepID=A0A8X6PGR1_NEPPI|nr:hypothetical protein NPIL_241311 [Nephila pilipes]
MDGVGAGPGDRPPGSLLGYSDLWFIVKGDTVLDQFGAPVLRDITSGSLGSEVAMIIGLSAEMEMIDWESLKPILRTGESGAWTRSGVIRSGQIDVNDQDGKTPSGCCTKEGSGSGFALWVIGGGQF